VSALIERSLRERLEEFYYAYAEAIDEHLERWPDFFTEDALYKAIANENYQQHLPLATMYCEGRGMILDRAMAVQRTIVHHPRTIRHFISNLRFETQGNEIHAKANFAVYETLEQGISRLFVVGQYLDRLIDTPQGLRFVDKLCVFDGDLVQGSVIYPL
jgi:salicylate 5-hydroxylase small subunit